MVYSSRFVVCVLVDGKPQKELANGTVPVPFGCEYSLRFRNKNNRRAVVKFTIDGEEVSGNGYIIPPHSAIDIHRHWGKDARFKFVELDSPEAVDFGKNGPNTDGSKGVVEARFYLEKEPPKYYNHPNPIPWYEYNKPWWTPTPTPYYTNEPYLPNWSYGGKIPTAGTYNSAEGVKHAVDCSMPEKINLGNCEIPNKINCCAPPQNVFPAATPAKLEEGCTVEGGHSGQTFSSSWIDLESDYVTLRLVLKGFKGALPEKVAHSEPYCRNCGAKKARPADNFCGVCGHRLK